MHRERQKADDNWPQSAARVRLRVAGLADAQHGVASLGQLVELGLAPRTVRHWVASGRLRRLHTGVYAVGHRALRTEGHWLAAALACGPGAFVSFFASGALHDLGARPARRIDVTVAGRTGRSRPGITVHCGQSLRADEVTEVRGVPCTSVARTIADLAGVLSERGVERLIERSVRVGTFDLFELSRVLARRTGHRGAGRLRRALAAWDPELSQARSELEVLFYRLLVDAGMELPLVNRQVEVGTESYEVDFHWPESRLIVETDGRAFHDTPTARRRDGRRDAALREAGWHVERIDWAATTQRAADTRARVARALERRSPARAAGSRRAADPGQ